jgi:hypothetical protein
MTDPLNMPDLIISLSHDNVRLELLGNASAGREPWAASYPIEALFMEEQLSEAFDNALNDNPILVDHFEQVEVVVVDSPHLSIPQHYVEGDEWSKIAGRYLRNRSGDKLFSDSVSSKALLAYNFPASTINLIHEYYANAGQLHLTSILWDSIYKQIKELQTVKARLFYILQGKNLVILGESSGKLTFSKTYFVPEKEDLHYYIIACNKMIQPAENWRVTINDEQVDFKLNEVPDVKFQHNMNLADMRTLIAQHRS